MITLWNTQEICAATGGKTTGDAALASVSIDSRTVQQDALFVALKGERFNGHDYVASALDQGAAAALVSETPKGLSPDDARLITVENTELALQQMGIAARARFAGKMVGVTGSVGKTGCKEMLRCALSALGSVYATQGNLNNHLGVPLSLANLPAETDFAVMEMGMNHAGEIRQLSHWVKPDVAVITAVEEVHIEFFDSILGIADAKAEIFEGMGQSGVAVLNADNAHFDRVYKHAIEQGLDRVIAFGTGEEALCRMLQYGLEGIQSVVDAMIGETRVHYRLGAIGKHWGLTSTAVLGVVEALGGDLAKSAEALAQFNEPEGRGRIEELPVKGGYLRLIDDSYNASPASMRAAFEKLYDLKQVDTSQPAPRTVAVLGDMLELGDKAEDLHVGLVPSLVNNQIDLVFAAGNLMKSMYEALPEAMRGDYDLTAGGLAPKVAKHLQARDLVLVKGSRGSRMDKVSGHLREGEKRNGNRPKEA